MQCVGRTDIGRKRKNNQDSFKINKSRQYISAVVCDGMGGAKGGSVASTTAVNTYTKYVRMSLAKTNLKNISADELENIIVSALHEANNFVYEKATTDTMLEGMGTTLVAVLVADKRTICVNVGDSRLYKVAGGVLEQITHDHSFVQFLIDNGTLTAEEAKEHPNKNIILKAIGVNEHVDCDVFYINDYDSLLLCTDGLTNMLTDQEISDVINMDIEPEAKVDILIENANMKGGTDNISAVLYCGKE